MQLESKGASRRRIISLTPLIDVVFILLLFFMLTTQFSRHQALSVNVPEPGSVNTSPDERQLVIALHADGSMRLGSGARIQTDALERHPDLLRARDKNLSVVVRPESHVPLGELIRLVDRLAGFGLSHVRLGDWQ